MRAYQMRVGYNAAALFMVLLLILVVPLSSCAENGGFSAMVPERPEMIDINAYETITLKADTALQSVRFENPIQNDCWLVITLLRGDGTELWKSEELQPGQVIRSITLNQPLAAGVYENAILRYQNWTYDSNKEPVNGAEILVRLIVTPDRLEWKADSLEQTVHFENPIENNCALVITLSLEDGTVLWTSEELQPGQVVSLITLNQPLAAGEYKNAVIKYEYLTQDEEKFPYGEVETLVTLTVGQP